MRLSEIKQKTNIALPRRIDYSNNGCYKDGGLFYAKQLNFRTAEYCNGEPKISARFGRKGH